MLPCPERKPTLGGSRKQNHSGTSINCSGESVVEDTEHTMRQTVRPQVRPEERARSADRVQRFSSGTNKYSSRRCGSRKRKRVLEEHTKECPRQHRRDDTSNHCIVEHGIMVGGMSVRPLPQRGCLRCSAARRRRGGQDKTMSTTWRTRLASGWTSQSLHIRNVFLEDGKLDVWQHFAVPSFFERLTTRTMYKHGC